MEAIGGWKRLANETAAEGNNWQFVEIGDVRLAGNFSVGLPPL